MKFASFALAILAAAGTPFARGDNDEILLESFDNPSHHWVQMNDPVMGGRSTGTFAIENGVGVFDGDVVDVPFLQAPGFIKVASHDSTTPFADVSSCTALKLTLKSSVDYEGYRVSFGNAHPKGARFFAFGYKANLKVPKSSLCGHFTDVEIPFKEFSSLWDDATGDQIKTCKDYPIYCPDTKTLENMKTISIWAEGVAGQVHLEIKSISASGCAAAETEEEV